MLHKILWLCLFCTTCHASKLPFNLPKELALAGGVIPPICFLNFIAEDRQVRPVNLSTNKCLRHKQPYNQHALKTGFIGYNIESMQPEMRQPSVFYRYLGKLKDEYYFLVNWSGGGTGFFSNLINLKLDNDILSLSDTIDTGDRCLGGISKASIKNNMLSYEKYTTPQMLFEVNAKQSKPFLFQDCAVCCIGTLEINAGKIVGLKFNGTIPQASPEEKAQYCFNKQIKKFGAKQKAYLSKNQLLKLVSVISQKCIPSQKS